MATIKEVAREAGVSFKTVSRVINDDPAVSETTRLRVRQAISMLGYRPNLSARQMRTQRSHFIGLLTDEIATTPFAVNLVKGTQAAAWASDQMLLLVNTEGDPEHEAEAIELLLERKVEGIIYATMRHRVITPPLALYEVPTVLANCCAADGSLPSIVPDEVQGGYVATEVLLRKGHRRIAFLNLEAGAVAASGRLEGYQRALETYGVSFDPALVRSTNGRPQPGYEQAQRVLDLPQPPTAFFCGNDQVAAGVYQAVLERGLRIPEDISVVGFDNLELIATYLHPELSTMALPHTEMGEWAVSHLREHAQSSGGPPVVQVALECPYIERESV